MSANQRFWWGVFGGLLPQVLRIYTTISAGQFPDFRWVLVVYFVGYAVSVGLFTIAWKPESALKAIWVGISFPVLASSLMQTPLSLPH
jgi:hypothetical protein